MINRAVRHGSRERVARRAVQRELEREVEIQPGGIDRGSEQRGFLHQLDVVRRVRALDEQNIGRVIVSHVAQRRVAEMSVHAVACDRVRRVVHLVEDIEDENVNACAPV